MLSIVLPTINRDLFERSLGPLRAGVGDLEHEIVVVSPFEAKGAGIRWVEDKERPGPPRAAQRGFEAARGEVVLVMNDDNAVTPGAIQLAYEFHGRRSAMFEPYACGLQVRPASVGTVFGLYYPYYPMIRRDSAERLGGFFDPAYGAGFCDADLALRVWHAGGRCELAPEAWIEPTNFEYRYTEARNRQVEADEITFVERWYGIFGQGWSRSRTEFSISLFDESEWFIDEHTICQNTPEFRRHWLFAAMARNVAAAKSMTLERALIRDFQRLTVWLAQELAKIPLPDRIE